MKEYSVKVNCPVTGRIETAYFYQYPDGITRYHGCEEQSGAAVCNRCREIESEKFQESHPDQRVG